MSGSNGGNYMPPKPADFDCEVTEITTMLSSINLTVLSKHKVGDKLELILSTNKTIIAEDGDGEILGSVIHQNNQDLIDCINKGNHYSAEIIQISNPACKVKIKKTND